MKFTKQKAFILAFISTLSLILIVGGKLSSMQKTEITPEEKTTNITEIKTIEISQEITLAPASAPIKSFKITKLDEIVIPQSIKDETIINAKIDELSKTQKVIEKTVIAQNTKKPTKDLLLQDIPEVILSTPIIPLEWELETKDETIEIALDETSEELFEIENNLEDGQLAFNETEVNYDKLYPDGIENSNVTKAVKLKMKEEPLKVEKWEPMQKFGDTNPWVVATSANKPRNVMLEGEEKAENTDVTEDIQVAKAQFEDIDNDVFEQLEENQQIKKNILIPLPEDLKGNSDNMPMLDSKPSEKRSRRREVKEENEETAIESIFDGIGSIFDKEEKPSKKIKRRKSKKINFFGLNDSEETTNKILPTEIRLSFQPNRAVISGQTLRWIHAFANKVKAEPNTAIEIRIDGSSSADLQQKRLNLLNNIFKNKHVNPYQVKIVFTNRQANTLILRTIKIANETNKPVANKNLYYQNRNHYQQW